MALPFGWQTDLAVLRLGGSEVEEYDDHLVVRTPANPTYYWGNFVLVTDPGAVGNAAGWLHRFESCFPEAEHRAIGLVADPADHAPWSAAGLFFELADVLVAPSTIPGRSLPAGYEVRELRTPEDWERSNRLRQLAFPDQDEFEERVTATRTEVTAGGALTWFGAFAGPELTAELGIVDCGGGLARYQSVLTHPDHRRRGLTSHLLGVAAAHATARGADRLVIIADGGSDAGRLYRAAGFALDSIEVQVSRVPGVVA